MALKFDMSKGDWQRDYMMQQAQNQGVNPYRELGENIARGGGLLGKAAYDKLLPEGGQKIMAKHPNWFKQTSGDIKGYTEATSAWHDAGADVDKKPKLTDYGLTQEGVKSAIDREDAGLSPKYKFTPFRGIAGIGSKAYKTLLPEGGKKIKEAFLPEGGKNIPKNLAALGGVGVTMANPLLGAIGGGGLILNEMRKDIKESNQKRRLEKRRRNIPISDPGDDISDPLRQGDDFDYQDMEYDDYSTPEIPTPLTSTGQKQGGYLNIHQTPEAYQESMFPYTSRERPSKDIPEERESSKRNKEAYAKKKHEWDMERMYQGTPKDIAGRMSRNPEFAEYMKDNYGWVADETGTNLISVEDAEKRDKFRNTLAGSMVRDEIKKEQKKKELEEIKQSMEDDTFDFDDREITKEKINKYAPEVDELDFSEPASREELDQYIDSPKGNPNSLGALVGQPSPTNLPFEESSHNVSDYSAEAQKHDMSSEEFLGNYEKAKQLMGDDLSIEDFSLWMEGGSKAIDALEYLKKKRKKK